MNTEGSNGRRRMHLYTPLHIYSFATEREEEPNSWTPSEDFIDVRFQHSGGGKRSQQQNCLLQPYLCDASRSAVHFTCRKADLLMYLVLMETSSPIVPALFPLSHRHDAVRLRCRHDGCVCSASTSGAPRKTFSTVSSHHRTACNVCIWTTSCRRK